MQTLIVISPENGHRLKLYIRNECVSLLRNDDSPFKKMAIADFAIDLDSDKIIKNRYFFNTQKLLEDYIEKNIEAIDRQ
jgi:hypothetical protein